MKSNRITVRAFGFTLFISAALMFSLQPMVGKMLLPVVGGTPAGWVVAMAFFQIMLLAGYFLAHALSRLSPRVQGVVYIAGLCFGIFFLPVTLGAHADLAGKAPMALEVFLLLSSAVAVPFAALSATASTLQRLFTTTSHASAKDPYFLYAASNLGSFAGLLLYPIVIEPSAGLKAQSQGWLCGYILLLAAAAACLALAGKGQPDERAAARHSAFPPSWKTRLEWLTLAFVPSSLMMAVTTHITVNVFSAPLVWTLPLSLYLLTFVIAFGSTKPSFYNKILVVQPIATALALLLAYIHAPVALSMSWQLFAFTIIALMCHMRLAQKRPLDNNRHHLTEFYFMMSAGGALGGVLNAFIVPFVFDRLLEYPLMLAFSCLLHPSIHKKPGRKQAALLLACLGGFALYAAIAGIAHMAAVKASAAAASLVIVLAMLTFYSYPRMIFIGGLAMILASELAAPGNIIAMSRNFYGTVRVIDLPYPIDGKTTTARTMIHGPIIHGLQVMDEEYARAPTSYYAAKGPVGDAFSLYPARKVAVLGLGTGTINCYGLPGSTFTFFEIDPAIISLAKQHFTFLSDCGQGDAPRHIVGDARLELARVGDEKFDMIILDTFSGDSIPTHLLSVEALQLYLQRLERNGLLLFNISNNFLKLADTVAVTGREAGLANMHKLNWAKDDPLGQASHWMALARQESTLAPLKKKGWAERVPPPAMSPWTDDYTNLLGTLLARP